MYVVFFLLTNSINYISGELVVPHYRNIFSGVFGSFFAKFTLVSSLGKGIFFAYLVFFLLLYRFVVTEIQTLFLYLSIYIYHIFICSG